MTLNKWWSTSECKIWIRPLNLRDLRVYELETPNVTMLSPALFQLYIYVLVRTLPLNFSAAINRVAFQIRNSDSVNTVVADVCTCCSQLMSVTRTLHFALSPSLSPPIASRSPSQHPCYLAEAQGSVLLHNRSHPRLLAAPSSASHRYPPHQPVRWTSTTLGSHCL